MINPIVDTLARRRRNNPILQAGAGGQPGPNDAANILKPARVRGELRTIAATMWAQYKKYFEKLDREAALGAAPGQITVRFLYL